MQGGSGGNGFGGGGGNFGMQGSSAGGAYGGVAGNHNTQGGGALGGIGGGTATDSGSKRTLVHARDSKPQKRPGAKTIPLNVGPDGISIADTGSLPVVTGMKIVGPDLKHPDGLVGDWSLDFGENGESSLKLRADGSFEWSSDRFLRVVEEGRLIGTWRVVNSRLYLDIPGANVFSCDVAKSITGGMKLLNRPGLTVTKQ
jgi:hypothetical protein